MAVFAIYPRSGIVRLGRSFREPLLIHQIDVGDLSSSAHAVSSIDHEIVEIFTSEAEMISQLPMTSRFAFYILVWYQVPRYQPTGRASSVLTQTYCAIDPCYSFGRCLIRAIAIGRGPSLATNLIKWMRTVAHPDRNGRRPRSLYDGLTPLLDNYIC